MNPLIAPPVERIAVFRALVLGDLLCAVPALRAIKAHWPAAELTLVGLPWARDWAARVPHIDRFEEFPGLAGLPERVPDAAAWPGFIERMRAGRFDLALQMHGSGSIVNPMVASFGARHTAGFHEPGERPPQHWLHTPWPTQGHEIERMLALTDHLGVARAGTHLEFPVEQEDRRQLSLQWPAWNTAAPYVVVHAGAQLPSRRWLPERFAEAADALADKGARIVLTGTRGEAPIVAAVQARMRSAATNLAGITSLWTLGALVENASLVVSNDTGIMHVAAALGTPSVAVSSGADVSRWAPLDHKLHAVLWQAMPCRPCSFNTCPYDHACARAIETSSVIAAATAF